jgi:diadenosine tetraphosphate (Ap4A) HIT family hydrolase
MIVAPARHVEQIDALGPEERAGLGPLLAAVAAALRLETPCEKVYLSAFAEVLPHLHIHVIARPPGMPAEETGPRLLEARTRCDEREARAVAERVLARLGSPAPPLPRPQPRPLRAALLSGLVCPGAGQLQNRDWAKGLALIGLTLVALVWLMWRTTVDVLQLLPADPDLLDPLLAFRLAHEVQQRNAGSFTVLTMLLVVLWIYAVVDAWRGARR